jgi:hypothetical protein
VQVLRAASFAERDEAAAQRRVGGRGLEEGLAQRAQVEARSADEERPRASISSIFRSASRAQSAAV